MAKSEEARLDEIAADISRIAPVVRSAITRTFANEISIEAAESIRRSAEVLLGLYELESDLLTARIAGARKVKRR